MTGTKTLDVAKYIDAAICADCGGYCCKQCAGPYFPEDFATLTAVSLTASLSSKAYAIDWWIGDPRDEDEDELDQAYFIRPAHKDVHSLRDPSWGGCCIHLTDKGCNLSFRQRPKGCRMLIPGRPSPDNCRLAGDLSSKQDAAIAWIPYQQIILDAEEIVEGDCE